MNVPELPSAKYVPWLILGLMIIMVFAYLLYLAATWNQYQMDRLSREEKINELLARFPRAKVTPDSEK